MDRIRSFVYSFIAGDSIGTGGTKWNNIDNSDKYFIFIAEGGINKIDVGESYKNSINSVFLIGIMQCLIEGRNKNMGLDKVLELVRKELVSISNLSRDKDLDLDSNGYVRSAIGRILRNEEQPYDNYVSNITCSMCLPIGIMFYKDCDQQKLIEYSIEISRLVQNSVIGYISGLVAALFCSYAMKEIPVELWGFKLMKLFSSKVIGDYINKVGKDIDEYKLGIVKYIEKWEEYMSLKFNNGNIVRKRSTMNLLWRSKYYSDLGFNTDSELVSSSGDNCMIVAYDCLLDSGKNWETLVFYSMLHIGDTSSTGAVAAALYGLIFGMNDIPNINYKNIKETEKLDKMITNLRK